MTRDEVMTDEELQGKTAELLGFVKATNKEVATSFNVSLEDGKRINENRQRWIWQGSDVNIPKNFDIDFVEVKAGGKTFAIGCISDYPNDIAAAWELVEDLRKREMYPEIQNVGIRGHLWNVWLDDDLIAQDEDAPRAITSAFILKMSN